MLIRFWKEGLFESHPAEVKMMAYFMMKNFVDLDIAQAMYEGKGSKKFNKFKNKVKYLVESNYPEWAKKFKDFKESLTEKQWAAIKAEWFYQTDEKATQEEIAQKMGINRDSYAERLEYAYKKLESLYPEWPRAPRRRKSEEETKVKVIPKLYLIKNGTRAEIEPPKKRKVQHSLSYFKQVKEWARTGTSDLARNLTTTYYASYEGNINFWVENGITPEAIYKKDQSKELEEDNQTDQEKVETGKNTQ